jgi:hypothetical protein
MKHNEALHIKTDPFVYQNTKGEITQIDQYVVINDQGQTVMNDRHFDSTLEAIDALEANRS